MKSRFPLRRRHFLLGALGLGSCEALSLAGKFDHWRRTPRTEGTPYEVSMARASQESGIVHIAHSTHAIVLEKKRFLTDPWFHDPAFGALGHAVLPAVLPEHVGPLDAVLVSHDHPDHADFRAIDRLDKHACVLVATASLAARAKRAGFSDVHVLAPWEAFPMGTVTVHAVPALHDVYEIGFVVKSHDKSVYFAGDTRTHPDLPAIAERLAPTFGILPVDGTRIRGTALAVMTPEDAIAAAKVLRVKGVMPSHAEAVFVDPLVEHALATTVPQASEAFGRLAVANLPNVTCALPAPGAFVPL
ncbi:MAG: MBL fold metallo-hydrolase [Polyangiaceae bacterium]